MARASASAFAFNSRCRLCQSNSTDSYCPLSLSTQSARTDFFLRRKTLKSHLPALSVRPTASDLAAYSTRVAAAVSMLSVAYFLISLLFALFAAVRSLFECASSLSTDHTKPCVHTVRPGGDHREIDVGKRHHLGALQLTTNGVYWPYIR